MMVEYDLTVDDVIAQRLFHDNQSSKVQVRRQRVLFLPTAFLLLFSVVLWIAETKRNPNELAPSQDVAVIFGLMVLYFATISALIHFYLPYRMKRIVCTMFAKGTNPELFGHQRVTLTAEGISIENGSGKTSRPWNTMEWIVMGVQDVYLYCDASTVLILPRRAFATDADFNAFFETARQSLRRSVVTISTNGEGEGQVTLEYELTGDDLIAFGVYYQDHSPAVKRQHFLHNGSWFVMTLLMPFVGCYLSDPHLINPLETFSKHWWLCLASPLYVVLLVVYYKFFHRERQQRFLRPHFDGSPQQLKLTVNPEGVKSETSNSQTLCTWESIQRVEVTEDHIFLFIHSSSAFIVPRRVFVTSAEFDTFLETIQGFLRKNKPVA